MSQQHKVGTHETTIASDVTHTVITYHRTQVVRYNSQEIILNSGGWRTSTTKTRMNQASNQFNLEYYVFQRDYEWFVDYQGEEIPFTDGLVLARN